MGEPAKLHLRLPIAPNRLYYRLNHSSPPPPTPSLEKLSSMKPVPGARKTGDRCLRSFILKLECSAFLGGHVKTHIAGPNP